MVTISTDTSVLALPKMKIDYYKCEDCPLTELGVQDAEIHRHASGHTVVPVYV
jgi:hypothetical protein